jgi:hypothetical protein
MARLPHLQKYTKVRNDGWAQLKWVANQELTLAASLRLNSNKRIGAQAILRH